MGMRFGGSEAKKSVPLEPGETIIHRADRKGHAVPADQGPIPDVEVTVHGTLSMMIVWFMTTGMPLLLLSEAWPLFEPLGFAYGQCVLFVLTVGTVLCVGLLCLGVFRVKLRLDDTGVTRVTRKGSTTIPWDDIASTAVVEIVEEDSQGRPRTVRRLRLVMVDGSTDDYSLVYSPRKLAEIDAHFEARGLDVTLCPHSMTRGRNVVLAILYALMSLLIFMVLASVFS